MKNLFKVLFVALATIAAVSCTKQSTAVSGNVTTVEATNVTADTFTLGATYEFNAPASSVAQVGVYISTKPGISSDAYTLSSDVEYVKTNKGTYSSVVKNSFELIGKIYMIKPGTTCYYRAYMHVIAPESSNTYYGEEKSFVVPAAK